MNINDLIDVLNKVRDQVGNVQIKIEVKNGSHEEVDLTSVNIPTNFETGKYCLIK